MTNLYETQRAMRQARKIAIQRGVIAVLDVGTSKVACFVLKFDGVKPRELEDSVGSMVGQADFRIIGVSTIKSRGVKFGDIDIIRETERAIRTAVQAAQKMAEAEVEVVSAALQNSFGNGLGKMTICDDFSIFQKKRKWCHFPKTNHRRPFEVPGVRGDPNRSE